MQRLVCRALEVWTGTAAKWQWLAGSVMGFAGQWARGHTWVLCLRLSRSNPGHCTGRLLLKVLGTFREECTGNLSNHESQRNQRWDVQPNEGNRTGVWMKSLGWVYLLPLEQPWLLLRGRWLLLYSSCLQVQSNVYYIETKDVSFEPLAITQPI